jgi:hypothetical protein
VQGLAHHTHGRRIVRTVQARHIDGSGDVSIRVAGFELRVAETDLHAAIEQVYHLQRAQRRSLQRDADAEHRPLRIQLDDLDLDPGALQSEGERHAGDTAADDKDFTDRRHFRSPILP